MLSVIDLLSYTDTYIFNVSVLNVYVYSFIFSESYYLSPYYYYFGSVTTNG